MDIKKALDVGMAMAGLNQRMLAKRVSLSPAAISKIVNGHSSPTLRTLEKMAWALGMTLSALIALGE